MVSTFQKTQDELNTSQYKDQLAQTLQNRTKDCTNMKLFYTETDLWSIRVSIAHSG